MTIDVEPTAKVIDGMVQRAAYLSRELEEAALRMRETGSFEYAAEAQRAVLSFLNNARLDLLITRPLREYERDEK